MFYPSPKSYSCQQTIHKSGFHTRFLLAPPPPQIFDKYNGTIIMGDRERERESKRNREEGGMDSVSKDMFCWSFVE